MIVGAGAAGSIVAARLAEDSAVSVCVLEAGPSDLRPFVYLPAGFTKTLTQEAVTWQFKTEPTENTAGRRISATQGRLVAGSRSINGMVYNRGQPADYDRWAQLDARQAQPDPDLLWSARIGRGMEFDRCSASASVVE